MTEIFIYDALKNKWDRKFTINKSPLPISPFTQSMKKMKIFAKFWQNILTHVVNISLKIWKFEGESPQNIEFDQQKHYSFSLWAEFRISTSVRQSSDVRKRQKILKLIFAKMMLRMFPHLGAWPVTVSNPRPPVPPAYTSPGLHFLLQIPRNQTGGPHLLWCCQKRSLFRNSCIFSLSCAPYALLFRAFDTKLSVDNPVAGLRIFG